MSNIKLVKTVITENGIEYSCPNCCHIQDISKNPSYIGICENCGQKISYITVHNNNISAINYQ